MAGEFTYVVLGASYLWPWNCMITASALARSRLAGHESLYANYSSAVMTTSTIVALLLNIIVAARPFHYAWRVKHGLVLIAASFLVAAVGSALLTGPAWFAMIIGAVAASSVGTGLTQNGVMAISQRIPGGKHALANMNGQAVAGVLPPLLAMTSSSGPRAAHMAPFTFVSVAMLACLALVLFESRGNREYIALAENEVTSEDELPSLTSLRSLLGTMWAPSTAILVGFIASLSYPVFANAVESRTLSWTLFSPLTHFVWNAGDLTGRLLCELSWLQVSSPRSLVSYSFGRLVLVVLLVILARAGNPSTILYLFVHYAFGVSGGHLISSSIAFLPRVVQPHLLPAAGGLICLVISWGLAAGALASFGVVPLL